MNHRCQIRTSVVAAALAGLVVGMVTRVVAEERRARAPQFSPADSQGVFFNELADAIRGTRPTIRSLQDTASVTRSTESQLKTAADDGPSDLGRWAKLVSPNSLEDEVKRVRLHFDSLITTPGEFKSGGYQDARVDLSVLATLFAIIQDYDGDVRWRDQAATARDLIARAAANCKAGSTQVYNEARLRKQDLQDLVSGSSINGPDADPQNDWAMIADRVPLMQYAEQLLEQLKDSSRNAAEINNRVDNITRTAELISVLGVVLRQQGMDDADDEDYQAHCQTMTQAGVVTATAVKRGDADSVRKAVGAIGQSCAGCHEEYR